MHLDIPIYCDSLLKSLESPTVHFTQVGYTSTATADYTPFYDARVAQTKPYYKDFKRPAALIFNQQSKALPCILHRLDILPPPRLICNSIY